MKHLIPALALLFISTTGMAQPSNFYDLLRFGKNELNRKNYLASVIHFEQAVALRPDHREARHYLASAYSRLNAADANHLPDMRLSLVLKTSSQLEALTQLSVPNTRTVLTPDPYSQITTEWGALALKYQYQKQTDSATWACQEGKKRGGFSAFVLDVNRSILNLCEKNAVLVSGGDLYTFPLLYLQQVEGLRPDVSVVDVRLLQTTWYSDFMSRSKRVRFDMNRKARKKIGPRTMLTDSVVTLGTITWTVRPTTPKYITRGGLFLVSVLKQNYPNRPIYFTMWMDK